MKKDFTKESEERLLAIIESVEPRNWYEKAFDWFGDAALTISEKWLGGLNINDYLNNIDAYHRKILDKNNTTKSQLKQIFSKVRSDDNIYARNIDRQVRNETIAPIKSYIDALCEIVDPSKGLFHAGTIKVKLGEISKALHENLKNLISPSYALEDGIHYGGNQGNAYDRWTHGDKKQFRKIIKMYYPGISDAEIAKMLNEMNNEGCNFMALVNTIFAQYAGREEEFEKTFGFPMYDEDGNPNWDYVMVDFYCHSGWYNGKEEGLTKRTSKEVWEAYMKSKKIHSEVVNVKVTVDNFYELAEGGEIIIGIRPVILRDSTGRIAWTHENAGHAMVITEVVTIGGKKMYKVSSWGGTYYIDPDDFDQTMRIEYQQVRY